MDITGITDGNEDQGSGSKSMGHTGGRTLALSGVVYVNFTIEDFLASDIQPQGTPQSTYTTLPPSFI